MQHRDGHGETLAEAPHELWRESDLGHQHQGTVSVLQAVRHRVQVDLGLAAAGDAMKQEGRELSGGGVDRGDRGGLLGAERGTGGAQ